MKKVLTTIFMLTTILTAFCQKGDKETNCYFLQAHPFDDIEQMYPSILYGLNQKKQLDTIYQISTEKEEIWAVNQYPKYKKLCVYKDGYWFDNLKRRLIVIDYTHKVSIKEIAFDSLHPKFTCHRNVFAIKKDDNLYADIQFSGRIDGQYKRINQGVNMKNLELRQLSPKDFKEVYLTGFSHSILSTIVIVGAYISKGESKLRIAETDNPEDRPIFPIEIPKEIWYAKEKTGAGIFINTEDVYVFMQRLDNTEQKYADMIVLDKESNEWRIRRNIPPPDRVFWKWLVGYYYENMDMEKDEFKVSPGKENRRQNHDAPTGWNFDGRAKMKFEYHTGRLYLYHIQTEAYIEWDTKQGDSEILLVEAEIVYYRVSDAIYKCPIVDGKSLGEPELIIKEDKVADIHWMFIADK